MSDVNMAKLKRMAKAFKALSNPNRLQIYLEVVNQRSKRVEEGPDRETVCGCGLADFISKLNIGAPTVSHHIKELVNADLISVERNGKYMTCFLNESTYNELKDFFDVKSLSRGTGILSANN